MKKILFPATSPIHLQRNILLLEELKKTFNVYITEYSQKEMSMPDIAVDISSKFKVALDQIKPDLVLIRADRFELLPCSMLSAYGDYKVAQLEAGDLSGVVDNKVRFAISHLSDYHFATNQESETRLKVMGFKNVWNFGSLDVEYALKILENTPKISPESKYLLVLYHSIPSEDSNELEAVLKRFPDYEIKRISGNKDYKKETVGERYGPEEFLNLMNNASCVVGNSSSGLKEASVMGVPVVDIGSRQQNRLKPENVIESQCVQEEIYNAIKYQLRHGRYKPSDLYYKEGTSKLIASRVRSLT